MTFDAALVAAVGSGRGAVAADRLCQACVELFGVDAAALSLVFDGANSGTLGVSSEQARVYDELQFTLGEGPCLSTAEARAPVLALDLADLDDNRWPVYAAAMVAHDIRSVFAVPVLIAGQYFGALDLFCRRPGTLSADVVEGALVAAELAELPMLDLLGLDLQASVGDPSSSAWEELAAITRSEVSQATGMLVAQLEVSPAVALVRLRAYAYAAGQNVSEVARDILERRVRLEED